MNKEINEKIKFGGALILFGVILLVGWMFLGRKFEKKNQKKPVLQGDFVNTINTTQIEINGAVLDVEVADTIEVMERGLGGREKINLGQGMWFVFSFEGEGDIWMKDMKFPIDIIWFDRDLKVVGLKENATLESYPEIFSSPPNALYVLEVGIGFVNKQKIKVGDVAKIIFSALERAN